MTSALHVLAVKYGQSIGVTRKVPWLLDFSLKSQKHWGYGRFVGEVFGDWGLFLL